MYVYAYTTRKSRKHNDTCTCERVRAQALARNRAQKTRCTRPRRSTSERMPGQILGVSVADLAKANKARSTAFSTVAVK